MFTIAVTLIIGVLLIEYFGGISVKSYYKRKLRVASAGKLVLTYDDGPGEWLESRLLEMLAREKVKVTFFVHSGRALENVAGAERLKHSGHEIAIHTAAHINAWETFPWRLLTDLRLAVKQLAPVATNEFLYRPPFGKLTLSTWIYTWLKRISLAFWTIDSGDTWDHFPEPRQIVDEFAKANGGIVLLHSHDREGNADRKAENYVLEVTDELIKLARSKNFEICCFSEIS